MKRYDLIIVTGEPFPLGLAATNRLLCYSTAIAKSKKVLVLTFGAPYNCTEHIGIASGVEFRYMHRKCDRPSKITRLFLLLFRYVKLLFLLLFKYKYRSIVFLSRKLTFAFFVKLIVTIKRGKLYREISESPDDIVNRYKRRFAMRANNLFDGFIVISQGIETSIRDYVGDRKKFFNLPILVQMDRFKDYGVSINKRDVAFYCSGGNAERDGLLDILNGFLLYKHRESSNTILDIATSFKSSDPYHKQAMDIISTHPEAFNYLGTLPTTEIPAKLMEASVLLLTPHKNYLTKGFPTKLGEYLASGTPIICSSINDLYEQIPDSVVRFVSPNAPHEICEALSEILPDNHESRELGLKGRIWVEQNYTMTKYTASLINFLQL